MNNIESFKQGDFFVLSTAFIKIYYLVTKREDNKLEIVDHIGNSEKDSWESFKQFLKNDRDANYEKISQREGKKQFIASFSKAVKTLAEHKKETKELENKKNNLERHLEKI
jgi:hypothetical protein